MVEPFSWRPKTVFLDPNTMYICSWDELKEAPLLRERVSQRIIKLIGRRQIAVVRGDNSDWRPAHKPGLLCDVLCCFFSSSSRRSEAPEHRFGRRVPKRQRNECGGGYLRE